MIELKNVVKTFSGKQEIKAVRGVNLTINDQDIYGIIGFSGAGKSTLVRIINQLEKQTSGEVIIDGINMEQLNSKKLNEQRQKIGMIFQHFNLLWSRTVFDNIALPLEIAHVDRAIIQKKVQDLIRLVGLEGRENTYPSQLSGGQKQRVGIARALANDPKILLCDEATSALDPDTTLAILKLLAEINQKLKVTIVMITHQMEVVQTICNQMAVMSDGKIVEEGEVKKLFAHPQHEVTKRFVQNIDSGKNIIELKEKLKKVYPYGAILRLNFNGDIANQPILAKVIRKVNFDVNFINSHLTADLNNILGVIYIHIDNGSKQEYSEFVNYLQEYGVEVEVL